MGESRIEIGNAAPPFRLEDQDGAKLALKDLRGSWVVLYFYPKDDTPGCTTEACEFSEGIEGFAGLDAVVLGCSPDSPDRHRRFMLKHDLRVRLLSDPEHAVMEAYGSTLPAGWPITGGRSAPRATPRRCGRSSRSCAADFGFRISDFPPTRQTPAAWLQWD